MPHVLIIPNFSSLPLNLSQQVSELFNSCYQMRLCRIWSRNAENSSALFYVVKRVTKSHVFLWCRHCGSFAS
jgi:hypothetical protein